MDATSYTLVSVLFLTLISFVTWRFYSFNIPQLGLQLKARIHLWVGLSHPILVAFLILFVACRTQALDSFLMALEHTPERLFSITLFAGFLLVLVEEYFFRGWLWAYLEERRVNSIGLVGFTAIAYTIWHLAIVFFMQGENLSFHQLPIYLLNIVLMGVIWGKMRLHTHSILIPILAHAIWNALSNQFFGWCVEGATLPLLDTAIYAPERGFMGIVFNGVFLWGYWIFNRKFY